MERHSRPRILNICTVVTRVVRPCLMMSQQGATLPALAVKGLAMLASPGLTMGTCQEATCQPGLKSFCLQTVPSEISVK